LTVFETILKVRFGHVDPAGIVYFPRIYDYLHDVFEELWEEHVGQRYYGLVCERRLGFPLVHADVDFRRPLRFGDRLRARVSCFRLGNTSLGLRYRLSVADEVCVEARMITTCIDLENMQPLPIPDDYRARFAELLEDA
jgi:4-hydroxybenzoyl-CoA thioesterase